MADIQQEMNWYPYISSDPEVLAGKPVIKGTRLSVDFILGLFAEGWTERQVLDSYPSVTPESLRAVFAYAAEALRDEDLTPEQIQELERRRDLLEREGPRGRPWREVLDPR